MRFFILLILVQLHTPLLAGGNQQTVGAKQHGMGQTGITQTDAFSAFNNIATTAFLKQSRVGIFLQNNYLQAPINNFNLAYTFKHDKLGAFSATTSFYGFGLYNETEIGFGYARNFGKKIATGIKLNYFRLAIAENGSRNLLSFNLGVLYKPISKLHVAFTIYNPARMKLEKLYKETLSTHFKAGAIYLPTKKLQIAVELEKDLIYPLQFNLGFNYNIHPYLSLRLGGATQPTLLTFGIGMHYKNLNIDFSSSWNIYLGYSPQISLQYIFKKDEKE